MSEFLIEFSTAFDYDTLKTGITLPVTLGYNSRTVDFEAKLDTGSSHCIFERRFGENLGLEIESGTLEKFGTATVGFTLTDTKLCCRFWKLKIIQPSISPKKNRLRAMFSADKAGSTT